MAAIDWITLLDLTGVFVFALSGALDAVRYRLDLLGVMVLATATGVGGGIVRDLILGQHPPAVFTNETYFLACIAGGLLVFFIGNKVQQQYKWVRVADAVGLGLFAAIGASKALSFGLGWAGVLMMAAVSAVGGGVIRDLLVREIPLVLRGDFYASAAILAGLVLLLADAAGWPPDWQLAAATVAGVGSRLLAMQFGLRLPQAPQPK